jgi:hypothetical protein
MVGCFVFASFGLNRICFHFLPEEKRSGHCRKIQGRQERHQSNTACHAGASKAQAGSAVPDAGF